MGAKSERKHCDINLTKIAVIEKGKSPIFDVEITGGWSIRPTQNQKFIDQIFHFSVFFCLIILACYIIAVHTLVYYETQDAANLENKVDYAFILHDQLKNTIQSLEFTVQSLKKDMNALRSELEMSKRNCQNHSRRRRSVTHYKNSTCNRPRTIETTAIHFTSRGPLHYERNPMGGILGPWISDRNAVARNEEAFGVTYERSERQIQISKGGLYFIYSQVTYEPSKRRATDIAVYSINVISSSNTTDKPSDESLAVCSVYIANVVHDLSCYTSTVRVLRPNDTVYLQQITKNTNINFLEDSTYFGLILLSES